MADLVGSVIIWMRPLVTPVPVVARVPRERPESFLVVHRLGGPRVPPVIDNPTVGLEAWGKTQDQAWALIQQGRALIWSLQGGTVNGIAVYRVEEFAGPAWLPDPDTDTPRYTVTLSIRHREHLAVP